MKRKNIAFLVLLLCATLFFVSHTAGLEVETAVNIVGEGVIAHEIELNTEKGYRGLKISDSFYTRSLGMYGLSEVNYTSDLCLIVSSRANSTIYQDFEYELTNIRQTTELKNYNIGTKQVFFADGNIVTVAALDATNHSSMVDLEMELEGTGGYKILAVNMKDPHVREYLDASTSNGSYEIMVSSSIGSNYFPAGPCDSWLECPWGPTWGGSMNP